MKSFKAVVWVLTSVVALAAIGCGGDSDDGAGNPSTLASKAVKDAGLEGVYRLAKSTTGYERAVHISNDRFDFEGAIFKINDVRPPYMFVSFLSISPDFEKKLKASDKVEKAQDYFKSITEIEYSFSPDGILYLNTTGKLDGVSYRYNGSYKRM